MPIRLFDDYLATGWKLIKETKNIFFHLLNSNDISKNKLKQGKPLGF
jgi:hypothetical protein